jgi:hypothetical protein
VVTANAFERGKRRAASSVGAWIDDERFHAAVPFLFTPDATRSSTDRSLAATVPAS